MAVRSRTLPTWLGLLGRRSGGGGGMTGASDIRPCDLSEIDVRDATLEITREQLDVMRRISGGDRVVVAIGGKGFEFERTGATIPARTVAQLLHRAWLVMPEYPLLAANHHAGRLTVRGQFALANCI
jgi:hypothetical protein